MSLKKCYNIHKLIQIDYLKFFDFQKATTVNNYEGGPMDFNPLFYPTDDILGKNNLEWMKTSREKNLHGGLNFLNIEEKNNQQKNRVSKKWV